jgi:hypothetical protein
MAAIDDDTLTRVHATNKDGDAVNLGGDTFESLHLRTSLSPHSISLRYEAVSDLAGHNVALQLVLGSCKGTHPRRICRSSRRSVAPRPSS